MMKRRSVLLCLAMASSAAGAADIANYDELMERARGGDYGPALLALRAAPLQGRALNDYIAVSGWAGRRDDVIRAYESYGRGVALPDYSLLQVARAYRDDRRWDDALAVYEDGARRFARDDAFGQGAVMTMADAGRLDEALERAEEQVRQRPADPDRRLTLSYVQTRRGEVFAALAEADRAYELAPGRTDVVREYILALRGARMAGPALRVADAHPAAVDARLLRRLQGDAVAEQVRMAALPSRGEAERFVIADRALAAYDRLKAQWGALQPPPEADLTRIRVDRLGALHARVRMREVVDEYEALRAQGARVPAYALSDVASAYLYLRQPEQAREIYRQALQASSTGGDDDAWLEDETGLYYALTEAETFGPADAVVQSAHARQPIWNYERGLETRVPNERKLAADRTLAMSRLYAGDTRDAQQSFDHMVGMAPNNTGLLVERAQVLRARELPRAAERDLKMAETLAPREPLVETGQGFTALDLQEWRQAEMLRDDMVARYPEDLGVRRLDREWQVHNKAELRIAGYRGLASDSPVSGSRDFGIDAVLYSPPLDYNWRPFVGGGYATGDFDEGRADYRWIRAGVQWRARDLTVQAEVSNNLYGHGAKVGAGLTAAYDIDDNWQVGGGAALRSRATPLRALKNNVYADSVEAYARWRADERREWRFGLTPSRFSDGNRRVEAVVEGRERLHTAPHARTDALLELSASHNTRTDAPYFNPRSALTVLPALRLTHLLHRRYETVWEQQFTAGAGAYLQRGYGAGAIGMLAYGQRYRANDVFEVGATVSGLTRPYDGERERELRVVFDMTIRF